MSSATQFPFKYNASYPINIPANGSFQPNSQLDFKVSCPGKKIVAGSWALNFDIVTQSTGVRPNNSVTASDDVYLSLWAGAHGMIQNIITAKGDGQVIENILNYGRCVAASKYNTLTTEKATGEVDQSVHCIAANKTLSNLMLQGCNEGGINNSILHVSLPLDFCLNNAFDDNGVKVDVPYSLLGDQNQELHLTLRLSPVNQMIFGDDAASFSVVLKNVLLTWQERVDDGKHGSIYLRIKNQVRNTLVSAQTNVQSFLPIASDGCTLSFIKIAHENSQIYDYYALETLPLNTSTNSVGTEYVDALINDQEVIYQYRQVSAQERAYNHLVAMGSTRSALTLSQFFQSGYGELYSMMFGHILDKAKISFNIYNPQIQSTQPYNCYTYYTGYIKL